MATTKSKKYLKLESTHPCLDIELESTKLVDASSKREAEKFLHLMESLRDQIDDLIGIKLLMRKNRKSLIMKRFFYIGELYNNSDDSFSYEYAALAYFFQQLFTIKDNKPHIFNRFRREILKQSHKRNWHGIRTEVAITNFLITACNFEFQKSESPDFMISVDKNKVFIESTMVYIEAEEASEVLYKIQSAINKKSNKKYANKNTALFIDTTNIMGKFFNGNQRPEADLVKPLSKYLMSADIPYGAIVFIWFAVIVVEKKYQMYHAVEYLDECSEHLSFFLHQLCPQTVEGARDPLFLEHS